MLKPEEPLTQNLLWLYLSFWDFKKALDEKGRMWNAKCKVKNAANGLGCFSVLGQL